MYLPKNGTYIFKLIRNTCIWPTIIDLIQLYFMYVILPLHYTFKWPCIYNFNSSSLLKRSLVSLDLKLQLYDFNTFS